MKTKTATFVDKAVNVHQHRYDYSKVEYTSCHEKVTIVCPKHGEFYQKPKIHLQKSGCRECSNEASSERQIAAAREGFVDKARIVHGNKFDYSLVDYKNHHEKVIIICKEHGEFHQTPSNHIQKKGCPKCGKNSKANKIINTARKGFVDKSRIVHSNKYDYSKVEYKRHNQKVIIVCKEHGEFRQSPNNHLQGSGCTECAKTKISAILIEQAALEFEPRSRIIHSNKYDYSKVVYKGSKEKVTIICKEHGDFPQTPGGHLDGNGCPECGKEKIAHNFLNLYETNKELGSEPGIFYLLKFKHASGFEFIKAGITSQSIRIRYRGKQYNDFTYEIIDEQHLTNLESAQKEREFIKENKEYKFDFPKDIKFNGHTETFNLDVLNY